MKYPEVKEDASPQPDTSAKVSTERRKNEPAGASEKRARIEAAIRAPVNLFVLSLAVAATAVMLSPWPLLFAIVLEVAYLGAAAAGLLNGGRTGLVQPSRSNMPEPIRPESTKSSKPSTERNGTVVTAHRREIRSPERRASDQITGNTQDRYLRLEATFRLIRLQLDEGNPVHREVIEHLEILMERFVYFARKQELFHERLDEIVADAKRLRAKSPVAAGVVDLQLVYASGDVPDGKGPEEWVQLKMKQAHDAYEQELREVAWRRQERTNSGADPSLDLRVKALLHSNKQVDRVGKTLLNLHYELQLLDKKFSMTSEELSTRRIEQVLADIKALVLQTQSLTRTVEEVEASESISESAAA